MIKTVKGKVIAGVVSVGLVMGAGGVVLGATDAGANLKAWFDGQFGKSTQDVASEVATYAGGQVDGLVNEYNVLKTDAKNSIDANGKLAAGAASKNINAMSREHIDAIKEEKAHIESYLSGQFDLLSHFASGLIDQAGNEALKYANNDLAQYTGAAGKAALDQVNNDVTAVTKQAVSDLDETIKGVKKDLQAQLDKETDLTIEEIKGLIDAKIIELRTKVTTIKNGLVKDQNTIITMKAKELQLAAEKEMQDLVDGI